MRVPCLLIVDDTYSSIERMKQKLADSNLRIDDVVVARSLAEAVVLIKQTNPEIILLDLDLGDSKSIPTLQAVRAITDAAIIVFVEDEDETLAANAIRAGADDFIVTSELCEICLRKSIVNCAARRAIRTTTKRMDEKLNKLSLMAGV